MKRNVIKWELHIDCQNNLTEEDKRLLFDYISGEVAKQVLQDEITLWETGPEELEKINAKEK